MSIKTYNVILDYLKLSLFTDNVDWFNRTLTITDKIEHIIVNIQHLQPIQQSNENVISLSLQLPLLSITSPAPAQQDIINYWNTIPDTIKHSIELIKDLRLNIEYFIAPFIITHNLIILGIIIYDNVIPSPNIIHNINNINYNIIENFVFVSILKQFNNHTKHKLQQQQYQNQHQHQHILCNTPSTPSTPSTPGTPNMYYNIINGILYNRVVYNKIPTFIHNNYKVYNLCNVYNNNNNNNNNNHNNHNNHNNISYTNIVSGVINSFKELSLNNIDTILEKNIKWDYILRNITNYIPSLLIVYKHKKQTNAFYNTML